MAIFKLISSGGSYVPGLPLSIVEIIDDETVVVRHGAQRRHLMKIADLRDDGVGKQAGAEVKRALAAAAKDGHDRHFDINHEGVQKAWFATRGMINNFQFGDVGAFVTRINGLGDFN
jgi:hypothetical protein